MNSEQKDVELEQLLSSYGLITIERILGNYQIRLATTTLSTLIKNRFNFYYDILQIPLRNVFNGIVIQQAHDYYVYAQKLYIDYLMSIEGAATEEAPGASIRETLEEERKYLIAMGNDFRELELRQDALIGSSQVCLMELCKEWNTKLETAVQSIRRMLNHVSNSQNAMSIKQAIEYGFIHCDLKTSQNRLVDTINEVLKLPLSTEQKEETVHHLLPLTEFSKGLNEQFEKFYPDVKEIKESARMYRRQIFDSILKAIELIKLLPEYKIDFQQDLVNKELLNFDKTIGEE